MRILIFLLALIGLYFVYWGYLIFEDYYYHPTQVHINTGVATPDYPNKYDYNVE